MRLGDTCVLVVDDALQAYCPELLKQWETDRIAEGWVVLPRVIGITDKAALRIRLLSLRPSHTFLAGDAIPRPALWWDPDGHGYRLQDADYWLLQDDAGNVIGAVGRIWFINQDAPPSSLERYSAYFVKRHLWAQRARTYNLRVPVVDHFHFPLYFELGILARAQVPDALLEELYPDEHDATMYSWATSSRIMAVVLAGGQPYPNPGGFIYFGGYADWRAADPAVPIFVGYGSNLSEGGWPNSFLTATLTCSHTLVAFWNFRSNLPFGDMFTGATAGECGQAAATMGGWLTNVYGDPTVALTQEVLTAAAVLDKVQGFDARLSKVENTLALAPAPITLVGVPAAPIPAAASIIQNGSFETPVLVPRSYQYTPPNAGWTFDVKAAVVSNGSPWGSPPAPDGSQVAAIQQGGSIEQVVGGLVAGNSYTLSFQTAQRTSQMLAGPQTLRILADGKEIGRVTPKAATWEAFSIQFAAGGTSARITIAGTATGDSSAFLDKVEVH